ncbi:MAG: hypothetical protein RLZ04_322 [Actinomycetota bacterium]|jgi:protocatechuate 3,4-dioxygenase beta subunit
MTNQTPPPAADVSRRSALALLGLAGVGAVAGFGVVALVSGDETSPSSSSATGAGASTVEPSATADAPAVNTLGGAVDDLSLTPGETSGPFPADGSNGADVLHDSRALRSDIRTDLDGANEQAGTPLDLAVTVLDGATGERVAGAAVYVWHCNKDGEYSAYPSGSYLRGAQPTDANGVARFTTVLPGRYPGRAFHVHFRVYSDTTFATELLTSQMAMDDAEIDALYADAGYDSALAADTDNAEDNVFADGVDHQMMVVAGDGASTLSATFVAVV